MLPKINKILYATDLSEGAKNAFFWAMSLAEKYDAGISVIHIMPDLIEEMSGFRVLDLTAHFGAEQLAKFKKEGRNEVMKSVKERIESVYGEIAEDIPSCRVDFRHIIIKTGHPVQEIVATADNDNYDIVIMGTHGHGLIDGLLLGSVARGVV
ncbi:MAG: universal stress protein, partial [Thermodesulfobacteriota bacterium]